jgi:hypothetical protein
MLSGAATLGGCGSTIGGLPLIGEPKETPAAPAKTPAFPSIGETPAQPADKPLTPAERQKVEDALEAARTQAVIDRRKQINGTSGQ